MITLKTMIRKVKSDCCLIVITNIFGNKCFNEVIRRVAIVRFNR